MNLFCTTIFMIIHCRSEPTAFSKGWQRSSIILKQVRKPLEALSDIKNEERELSCITLSERAEVQK